jgi:hypothetical protein
MKQLTIFITLFFLTIGQNTFACDCESQGEFLKVAPKSKFVALVKVTKFLSYKDIYKDKTPMSMEIEVIETYKGTETRKTLTVWGDNGVLCRPYLSHFKVGQYYVIAFYQGSDGSKGHVHEKETPNDYVISICGDYWLKADIKNRIATGSITDKKSEIGLDELKTKLR